MTMVFRHAEIGGRVFPPCGAVERGFGDGGDWFGFGRGWMLHVQCGFGIVLTESEREDFFGPLGCRAAIDGAFCCGSASLGGGLGAGEAPPSKISVGSAMPRNSASLRGAARRRLNDASKNR